MLDISRKTDVIVNQLKPFYYETINILQEIDGKLKHRYEAGVFVISMAIIIILDSESKNLENLADHASSKWLDFISEVENVNKTFLVQALQKNYSIYRNLFFNMLETSNDSDRNDKAIQLIWELHCNCTGKKSPDDFLKMALAAGQIGVLSLEIMDKLNDN